MLGKTGICAHAIIARKKGMILCTQGKRQERGGYTYFEMGVYLAIISVEIGTLIYSLCQHNFY